MLYNFVTHIMHTFIKIHIKMEYGRITLKTPKSVSDTGNPYHVACLLMYGDTVVQHIVYCLICLISCITIWSISLMSPGLRLTYTDAPWNKKCEKSLWDQYMSPYIIHIYPNVWYYSFVAWKYMANEFLTNCWRVSWVHIIKK